MVVALIVLTCFPNPSNFSPTPVNTQGKPRAIIYPTCTPMWGNMAALTCISTFSEINVESRPIWLQGPIDLPEIETCLKLPADFAHHGRYLKNSFQSQNMNSHEPQSCFLTSLRLSLLPYLVDERRLDRLCACNSLMTSQVPLIDQKVYLSPLLSDLPR